MENKGTIFITSKENTVYYGYFENGSPLELYCEQKEKAFQIGDIYVARVDRLAEGIQGAFVTIQKGEKAFYRLNKQYPKELIKLSTGHEDKLYGGDLILLQLTKESSGDKLPIVSEKITIQSAYFVLSFADYRLSLSKKITSDTEKARITQIMQEHKRDSFGLLARTAASDVDQETLQTDLSSLIMQYDEIMRKAQIAPGGSLIYKQPENYITLAKEAGQGHLEKIVTDDKEIFQALQDYYRMQSYTGILDKIQLYQDDYALWSLYRLQHYYDQALGRKVYLKSGGSIVIDPTEAMTVIDVNSGSVIKKKKADALYYQMNIEAADEILRQIRLRNISGIIIIDFINMRKKEDQRALMDYLKEQCKSDRISLQLVDMTALGLVELVRERRQLSLKEQWRN